MAKDRLQFPMLGKNLNFAARTQPPFTSPDMNNVRAFDVLAGRARGGQRPGFVKVFTQDIGNGTPVVALDQITTVEL
jgi:hypothetical protein